MRSARALVFSVTFGSPLGISLVSGPGKGAQCDVDGPLFNAFN